MIIDLHLDLAMNAMEWNRDLRLPVDRINAREQGLKDLPGRGNAVVSLSELRKGNIGLVVATQIARFVEEGSDLPGWNSPQQAWAQTQAQLAWYKTMEAAEEMRMIKDVKTLDDHLTKWNADKKTIGYILSLEGADSLVTPEYLEIAHAYGLRAVGPAHYGPGRYANGTNSTGGLNTMGIELLKKMEKLNIILDATHLCDDAFWDALNNFSGHVWASHNNCRSIVDHNRQFSDEMIKKLISRNAIIGAAFDAWMIVPNWRKGESTPLNMNCSLEKVVDHIDHICQLAGNADHVAIGTDLDGGFGNEQCPHDIKSIADLQKLYPIFGKRGYNQQQIEGIMQNNFLKFLRRAWT